MYAHHEKAIGQLIAYFAPNKDVIALILGGSVAKGCERPDSDIDAMVVVTPAFYEKQAKNNALAECIYGICEYEGGYFDVKYYTKDFLVQAATHGSEPARNAYISSRVLFTHDDEIEALVAAIPVFQQSERAEKTAVFHACLMMNHHYFWGLCEENLLLKVRTATEILYAAYRLILQENGILFPSNRRLPETVAKAPNKPDNILALGDAFLQKLDNTSEQAFVNSILEWASFETPDPRADQTKYVEYYELWWKNPRPFVNEW